MKILFPDGLWEQKTLLGHLDPASKSAVLDLGTLVALSSTKREGLDLMMSKSLLETPGSFITRLRRA